MSLSHPSGRYRVLFGVGLAIASGLLLWAIPLGDPWIHASYDWLFRFSARAVTNQVILVEMDTAAYGELHQRRGQPWDRLVHAQLLDHLRADGCPLVVLDIWFGDKREPASDAALANAIRQHGQVVLLADVADPAHPLVAGNQVLPPHPLFREAAKSWGVGRAVWDRDGVVRRAWNDPEPDGILTLPEAAAELFRGKLELAPVIAGQEQWLRYYGPEGAWTRLSYHFATNQAPGFFRNKVVFVGNRPETQAAGDEPDEFRTPYTRWKGRCASGMEIQATAFLNLANGHTLRRLAAWQEALALVLIGGMLGGWLSLFRRPLVLGLGLGAALVVGAVGVCLGHFSHWWFPWLVVAGGQIPVGVAWVCWSGRKISQTSASAATVLSPKTSVSQAGPLTPGFLRVEPPIGEGSYGTVWLVRNAVGEWQALKVIFRAKFSDDTPYEREFNGIKHHTPISRDCAGLLRIFFVSEKNRDGYFYYVMELGDALEPGWEAHPATYKPRDLASVCRQRDKHRLPVQECLRIGEALAESLGFLHRHGFIHRDIKPANVIFVKGQPKLADVGLVTEIQPVDRNASYVGTEGYLPPEGPGQPQGDIYSLGMLLYVIGTGELPSRTLDLSPTLVENAPEFMPLNRILWKACALEPKERYASMEELRDALLALEGQLDRDGTTRQ